MLETKFIRGKIQEKRAASGSSLTDESLIVAMQLENQFGLAHTDATDQTSQSGEDYGIDGWHYCQNKKLHIFQSKLTENHHQIKNGLNDLLRAADWLFLVLSKNKLEKKPSNNALHNLAQICPTVNGKIAAIRFVLLSPYEEESQLEKGLAGVKLEEFKQTLSAHELNRLYNIEFSIEPYLLKSNKIPRPPKKYPVKQFEESTLSYKSGSLRIVYLPLEQLVELYKQRGPELFHKNIRLTVWDAKKNSSKRVAHPMKETLKAIVTGKEQPEVFAFYHSGVTLFADKAEFTDSSVLLENPSIINGCQTTTIATSFLEDINIKRNKSYEENLKRFKQINVIAKIITGVGSDDLREITNNNNRQNPIEGWQLYSNDPIHIKLESALRESKIFYGRQAGLYKEQMKNADVFQYYGQYSKTELSPKILGQVLAIYHRHYNLAAKPDTIFETKEAHDLIFSENILNQVDQFVFRVNSNRSIRNAIKDHLNTLEIGTRDSYDALLGNNRRLYYAIEHLLIKIAEKEMNDELMQKTKLVLFKTAAPTVTSFYLSIVSKVLKFAKAWHKANIEGKRDEVTSNLLNEFVNEGYGRWGITK
ncbi:MAG: AIPR family protein [Bdellovibrio sp.]